MILAFILLTFHILGMPAILDSLHQQSGVPKVYLAVGLLILGSVITIKLAGFPAFW